MKFGLILLVALFGVLMLAAGLSVPAAFKADLAQLAKPLTNALGMAASAAAAASGAAHLPAAASAASAGGKTASAAAAKPAGPPANAASAVDLLLPAVLPAKGQYALQVGQFGDSASADAAAAKLKPLHLAYLVVPVVDQFGNPGYVLAVGPYASVPEAQGAQPLLDTVLHGSAPLPVILLPPPPKG